MAEIFYGIPQVLDYAEPGKRENPCLAVDLAMLGVGSMVEAHEALVASGVSDERGNALIERNVQLDINGQTVRLDVAKAFFELNTFHADSRVQFEQGAGTIVPVPLNEEDPDDMSMHLILFGGHYRDGDTVTRIVVGDSLVDGVQSLPVEVVDERLERTLEHVGAILAHHVSIA